MRFQYLLLSITATIMFFSHSTMQHLSDLRKIISTLESSQASACDSALGDDSQFHTYSSTTYQLVKKTKIYFPKSKGADCNSPEKHSVFSLSAKTGWQLQDRQSGSTVPSHDLSSRSSYANETGSMNNTRQGNDTSSGDHSVEDREKLRNLRKKSQEISIWMGSMLNMYFAAMILIKIIFNLIHHSSIKILTFFDGRYSRKLRKYLLLPSISHHGVKSKPLSICNFTFLLPQRQDAVIVVIWIGLFLLAISWQYFGATGKILLSMIGLRSGYICIFLLPLLFLFGGRNNFLMWCTGWTMSTFNVYHKWIARIEVLSVLIHGCAYTKLYVNEGYFSYVWQYSYMWWGFIALMVGVFICIQAMHWFRQRHYESFLIIHIVLVVLFLAFGYLHCEQMSLTGEYLPYYYTSMAVWGFDRAARLLRLLYSGRATGQITFHEKSNVLLVEITHANRWRFYPGCFAYLYFSDKKKFWQSHPFTLYQSQKGSLMAGIRVMNGITKDIAMRCLEQPMNQVTMNIGLEGPYGSKHKLSIYSKRVIIAGGIGFTAVYPYAAEAANEPPNHEKTTSFLWVVKDHAMLNTFDGELDFLKEKGVEVRLCVTGKPISEANSGVSDTSTSFAADKTIEDSAIGDLSLFDDIVEFERPEVDAIVRRELQIAHGSVAVLCCGPGAMNDAVRYSIVDNFEQSKHRVDYFEDNFSW